MKYLDLKRILTLSTALACACVGALAQGNRPTSTTTVTSATGTIAQVNYDESGAVASFLVGANTLISFPGTVCAGIASLGAAGNAITYSGTSVTWSSGFSSVSVTSFTNNTTGATWTKSMSTLLTALVVFF